MEYLSAINTNRTDGVSSSCQLQCSSGQVGSPWKRQGPTAAGVNLCSISAPMCLLVTHRLTLHKIVMTDVLQAAKCPNKTYCMSWPKPIPARAAYTTDMLPNHSRVPPIRCPVTHSPQAPYSEGVMTNVPHSKRVCATWNCGNDVTLDHTHTIHVSNTRLYSTDKTPP